MGQLMPGLLPYVVLVQSANVDEEYIRCMAYAAGWRLLSDGKRDHGVAYGRPVTRVCFESERVARSFITQCAQEGFKFRVRFPENRVIQRGNVRLAQP